VQVRARRTRRPRRSWKASPDTTRHQEGSARRADCCGRPGCPTASPSLHEPRGPDALRAGRDWLIDMRQIGPQRHHGHDRGSQHVTELRAGTSRCPVTLSAATRWSRTSTRQVPVKEISHNTTAATPTRCSTALPEAEPGSRSRERKRYVGSSSDDCSTRRRILHYAQWHRIVPHKRQGQGIGRSRRATT